MLKIIRREPATRPFEMVIGLSDKKMLHDMETAERIILAWLKKEHLRKGPYLPGRIDFNVMLSLNDEGKEVKTDVAIYKGIVRLSSLNEPEDLQVIQSLERLAQDLARSFNQRQISFTYRDTVHTVG